jgi:hypothetical protein
MSVNSFNASNPPLTTKGDLYGFSTVPSRVAVGANGTVLTADSTNANGVAWAAAASTGKSWVQVATGSLSGSALTFTSLSGYDNYILLAYSISLTTTAGSVTVTYNNDTANYRTLAALTGSGANITTAAASIGIDTTQLTGTLIHQVNGCLSSSGSKSYNSLGSRTQATAAGYSSAGVYASNTAITRIDLTTTDTFDNGTYFLYGSN